MTNHYMPINVFNNQLKFNLQIFKDRIKAKINTMFLPTLASLCGYH